MLSCIVVNVFLNFLNWLWIGWCCNNW